MKTVRRGVFETNSSSTHALSIHKRSTLSPRSFPKRVHLELLELSGHYVAKTFEDKCCVVYTWLLHGDTPHHVIEFFEYLEDNGVKVIREKLSDRYIDPKFAINHEIAYDRLDERFSDREFLERFLSDGSEYHVGRDIVQDYDRLKDRKGYVFFTDGDFEL